MTNLTRPAPPDHAQRERALRPGRSILVQAPAGSGKTDLLTRRFLRLLAEVDDPTQIVAITFTKAAAAEMRHRILSELEKAALNSAALDPTDGSSMASLAHLALQRSRLLGWNLLDLPAQLRISTIDSFCRELALRQPLLTGLGGGLDVTEQPREIYRRAARNTLQHLSGAANPRLTEAMESLLTWRDNGWQDLEDQLVEMLEKRDRWMQEFWLSDFGAHAEPDWDVLRERLERPFSRAVARAVADVNALLSQVPGACGEALELARFACSQNGSHRELAELAEFPAGPIASSAEIEEALHVFTCLADLLMTKNGTFRQSVDKNHGFPTDRRSEKQRILDLARRLDAIPGLESALASMREMPPPRYTEDDWAIVRACFTILHHAVGELQVAFSESGVVDFTEVAQIAQRVLTGDDQFPSEAAFTVADGIHHLLVDEFQDTSRRQHRLISSIVSAWTDTAQRTVFVVGDPMQSIYFFRDADAELFPRVQNLGLDLPNADPLQFEFVPLSSNFRTAPDLVTRLNEVFEAVFGVDDGSGVRFSSAQPARPSSAAPEPRFDLHLEFVPQAPRITAGHPDARRARHEAAEAREQALQSHVRQLIELIRSHEERIQQARERGEKYRIAVLGRTRSALAPIARALRDAGIPFRALDLDNLADRPEVLDALSLARALFNPEDRVAWLGVLRAPWCGLSLVDLHTLAGGDDPELQRRALPELMRVRMSLISPEGRAAVERLLQALAGASRMRADIPASSLGTWLEQIWLRLGGASCVDATARVNLALLWRCLDNLPLGEPDLLGRGLTTALASLMAQPDPDSGADHGVQLMTIHKSKGLEFEVVIVPELHARCATTRGKLLSWFERGLAQPDDSGEITEFLVAPLPSKGTEASPTRKWVDRAYRDREKQEMRRILYVAATRAREQLHIFARPAYKFDRGQLILCEPPESLLLTAWPAVQQEVRERFEAWRMDRPDSQIAALAASESNVVFMPSPLKPAILHRLPIEFEPPAASRPTLPQSDRLATSTANLYSRHEGGLLSRALGSAVHSLLEDLARLRATSDSAAACTSLPSCVPRVAAQIRAAGVAPSQSRTIADRALAIVLRAAVDPIAEWILAPHTDAASEVRWTGVIQQTLRTVQIDRVFRAGAAPLSAGHEAWWIVDYKTAHDDADPAAALPRLRPLFAPQLELYARFLRMLHGHDTVVRAGLYYPRMLQFDWWEL